MTSHPIQEAPQHQHGAGSLPTLRQPGDSNELMQIQIRREQARKSAVSAIFADKLAAFQAVKVIEADNLEASELTPRGVRVGAKLAAFTKLGTDVIEAPPLTHMSHKWKPRGDVFGSYARRRIFDRNAADLPPTRSITELP